MIEDNFGENDPFVTTDMNNVEDSYDIEIIDRENVELPKIAGILDNKEFVEKRENIEENLENVVNMENPENVENVENQEKVENTENMVNPVNVENVENRENPEIVVDNVEDMDNQVTVENVENLENAVNVANVGNSERVTDVKEESHQENSQGTENNLEVEGKRWPGWPGVNVFRMLVPVERVGSLIGPKGEIIKKICEETKSLIKILDGPLNENERIVLVSAKEEPHLPISPAMEGLLRVHKHIIDEVIPGGIICTRILVPPSQAGFFIGKLGSTIKSIQDTSNCNMSVLNGEHLPASSLLDDRVIEVKGESSGVHKAVELIVSLLRKFLVDRTVVELFRRQVPPFQHWTPQGFPVAGPGPGYIPSPQNMPPPHPCCNTYYPPGENFLMDKQPRQFPSSHGRDHLYLAHGQDHSMGGHVTNGKPHQSILVPKVTHNMHIPISYADTVIGTAGSNISYIRRSSGATVAVQETSLDRGEMTLEINGSASQVQAAHQLIQTFMTEAANNAQNTVGEPHGQGYHPYPYKRSC